MVVYLLDTNVDMRLVEANFIARAYFNLEVLHVTVQSHCKTRGPTPCAGPRGATVTGPCVIVACLAGLPAPRRTRHDSEHQRARGLRRCTGRPQ